MKIPASGKGPPDAGRQPRLQPTWLKTLVNILATSVFTIVVTFWIILKNPAEPVLDWLRNRGFDQMQSWDLPRIAMALPKQVVTPKTGLPRLVLNMKFKHIEKIRRKRAQALENQKLVTSKEDFVPAKIQIGGRMVRASIRLKGDLLDHLRENKWSFRVHVRRGDHIFGMRRLSLQHPNTRAFHNEILFLETLRHLDLLAPRYFFVDVILNGSNLGIMALEEHFSKELLESQHRREGVIVRYDEANVWAAYDPETNPSGYKSIYTDFRNARVDAFRSSKIAKSPTLSKANDASVGLLRGFAEQSLAASEVFDVESMGRFLAAVELWGARHALFWNNMRFYVNPITMKLEPIGFDASLDFHKIDRTIVTQVEEFTATILEDPLIFAAFEKNLRILAGQIIDGSLTTKLKAVEKKYLATLQTEFFLLGAYDFPKLVERARYLQGLVPDELVSDKVDLGRYPVLIHAYRIVDGGRRFLEIENAIEHTLDVSAINWIRKSDGHTLTFEPITQIRTPIRLTRRRLYEKSSITRIPYRPPADADNYTLQVSVSAKGAKQPQTITAVPYHKSLSSHPIEISTLDRQLKQHAFLRADETTRTLHVRRGTWRVKGSLFVPPGYSLAIGGGTTLRFAANEGVLAHGPVMLNGTADAPVVLEGSSKSGDARAWRGIAVLKADKRSIWSHAIIRDTNAVTRMNWQLTGGVTFYRSDVTMTQCRLEGSQAEDALNIIRSKFSLVDITVLNTVSDAFDADFSEGSVQGGVFENIGIAGGGDAIDVSGTTVTVRGTRFLGIGDKALSVGEGSTMSAEDIVVERAITGAASKDGSSLTLRGATIKDTRSAALMAYIKKPEYGAARIDASGLTLERNEGAARAQTASSIQIDGQPVATESFDVDALYATIMKSARRP